MLCVFSYCNVLRLVTAREKSKSKQHLHHIRRILESLRHPFISPVSSPDVSFAADLGECQRSVDSTSKRKYSTYRCSYRPDVTHLSSQTLFPSKCLLAGWIVNCKSHFMAQHSGWIKVKLTFLTAQGKKLLRSLSRRHRTRLATQPGGNLAAIGYTSFFG